MAAGTSNGDTARRVAVITISCGAASSETARAPAANGAAAVRAANAIPSDFMGKKASRPKVEEDAKGAVSLGNHDFHETAARCGDREAGLPRYGWRFSSGPPVPRFCTNFRTDAEQ